MNALISEAAEEFAAAYTTPFDGALAAAWKWTDANTSWPGMMAGVPEARLLEALIVVSGARSVLELGTFTGVGALAMAAAMPEGGRVVTLEHDPDNAAVARRHIAASPLADRIELVQGDARETLGRLPGAFDVVWIDAWKADYPRYLELVVPKLTPRGIIVADNLFRGGATLRPAADDAATQGVLEFARRVQENKLLHNVLLTVGDGLLLAWPARTEPPLTRSADRRSPETGRSTRLTNED
ncbi:MAG: O-methyltransferase [Solirubrobacteraceae bacterium]